MAEGTIWSYEELLRKGPGHDYIYSLLTDNIDAHFLEACAASSPPLMMVANMAVGFNNIDVDTAPRPGVPVANTPVGLFVTPLEPLIYLLKATAAPHPVVHAFLSLSETTVSG